MNQAMLMKICWDLLSSTDSLWIRVLSTKYGFDPMNPPIALSNKIAPIFGDQ